MRTDEIISFKSFPKLRGLYIGISDCYYGGIDISNNLELKDLRLSETSINTNLDLSNNTSLKNIDLYSPSDKIVSYIKFPASAEKISCNCKLANLNISNATKLKYFHLTGAQISDLDLSNNSVIEDVYIDGCDKLTNIDLTKNTRLKEFGLEHFNDNLVNIDFTYNRMLEKLTLGCAMDEKPHSNYKHINLTNCTKLRYAEITGVNLDTIDLTKNKALEYVYICNINRNIQVRGLFENCNNYYVGCYGEDKPLFHSS